MAIKQSGETHFYFPSLFLPWSLKMLRQGSKAKSNEPRHEPGLTKRRVFSGRKEEDKLGEIRQHEDAVVQEKPLLLLVVVVVVVVVEKSIAKNIVFDCKGRVGGSQEEEKFRFSGGLACS
ncbi:hypothetical protein CRG98_045784 [Punica granatum]|uniref:Uncharacterized protein n=1 Tax=Punica granatum TaxID=22663 RepID=A0A2I0HQ35_PUNGR|nr:hypothetical protein CRG98_045784 [Punica granatum]